MNEAIIRKRKWFWSWQDEKQEAWLGEMSSKGLHLKGTGPFGSFLFVEGSPREYSYRLDYNRNKPSEDYIQLLQDAGWENLGSQGGWQYWRKEAQDGNIPEVFTDPESKIQKYQQMLASFIASTPGVSVVYIIGVAAFKRFPGRHPLWFVILFISLFMAWIAFAVFNAVKIQMRIKELNQKKVL
jgi:hypothetical protein